jgi:hypothetical protein
VFPFISPFAEHVEVGMPMTSIPNLVQNFVAFNNYFFAIIDEVIKKMYF